MLNIWKKKETVLLLKCLHLLVDYLLAQKLCLLFVVHDCTCDVPEMEGSNFVLMCHGRQRVTIQTYTYIVLYDMRIRM